MGSNGLWSAVFELKECVALGKSAWDVTHRHGAPSLWNGKVVFLKAPVCFFGDAAELYIYKSMQHESMDMSELQQQQQKSRCSCNLQL